MFAPSVERIARSCFRLGGGTPHVSIFWDGQTSRSVENPPRMRHITFLILLSLVSSPVFARLGEAENELLKRFGTPMLRQTHAVAFQGRTYILGPSFVFKSEDWRITCDLIDGRCARIHYAKTGDWSDEQFATVRNANGQGLKWRETSKPETGKFFREWRREDGAVAVWRTGTEMKITVPAYERAKDIAEAKAKAEAAKPAKI
jgi:hypothetical protein